jgi:parallel beta-helix repeat protein
MTIYVDADATGANDGTSWVNAHRHLQDALAVASGYDRIRVAQGTYRPDQGAGRTPGDRTAAFSLDGGVSIAGGYAGFGEADPNARDISQYETILSGDLAGNDVRGLSDPSRDENSYHVLTAGGIDALVILLDGVTITGGNANHSTWGQPGDDPDNCGGGVYYVQNVYGHNSRPTIRDCTFRGNAAEYGGAFYTYASEGSPKFTNCTFHDNLAYHGGAMYDSGGNARIIRCTFSQNRGGAWVSSGWTSEAMATNCIFTGNLGGGINLSGSGNQLLLANCAFSGNQGVGMSVSNQSEAALRNCTFSGNSADSGAAGIRTNIANAPVLTNCILWGNTSGGATDEAAQIKTAGTGSVNYCCIQGWTGTLAGTGNIGAAPLFVDADGADNVAGTQDDNLRLLPGSPCIDAADSNAVPADWADLDDDWNSAEPTPWDLDDHERFVDDPDTADAGSGPSPIVDMGAYEGPDQGLLVSTESVTVLEGQTATFTVALAMDPGDAVQVTVAHASGDGDLTIQSGATLTFSSTNYSDPQPVTLGAAEDGDNINSTALFWISGAAPLAAGVNAIEGDNEPVAAILHVDDSAPGLNRGSNWAEAYAQLRDALYVATMNPHVEEIRVAQGTYTPTGPTGDRNATFQLINGVALKGGYAGFNAPAPDARDVEAYETVLSGDLGDDDAAVVDASDLRAEPTRKENSYHVLTGSGTDGSAILDGFTITGGNADGLKPDDRGGGMYSEYGSPTVKHCTFRANSCAEEGGAMCYYQCYQSDPVITDCLFVANAAYEGGGMWNFNSDTDVNECTFTDNRVVYAGGGMSNEGGGQTVSNCIFRSNRASQGGGMHNNASAMVTNCLFTENHALSGGGMRNWGGRPEIVNCLFTRNVADNRGGGIYNRESVAMTRRSTFHQNRADYGGGMYYYSQDILVAEALAYCTFIGNRAEDSGGGVYNSTGFGALYLLNCLFSGNWAGSHGGAMASHWYSLPYFTNCTVVGNVAATGGGIVNFEGCKSTLCNCIVWGNRDAGGTNESAQIYTAASGEEFFVDYSCVQGWTGGWGGTGNIGDDPEFVREPSDGGDGWGDDLDTPDVDEGTDDDYGDLRLSSGSPCIDAGDNGAQLLTPEFMPTDMDGQPRLYDDPGTPDTGNGTAPIVDMGTDEFQPHGLSHDWNGDGIVSIVGDVPPFLDCVYFQNCPGDVDAVAVGDCNGDGILSIVGDVPCFVDCVYFGDCTN